MASSSLHMCLVSDLGSSSAKTALWACGIREEPRGTLTLIVRAGVICGVHKDDIWL